MPLIREQRRVNPAQPGGLVPTQGAQVWGRSVANATAQAAQAASQIANVLTGVEVEEAVALASNAAITLNDDGVPQVDRSARERMGKAAQRAYDKTINQRYQQRLTVSLYQTLDELALEYEGDPDGFAAAAAATVEGMAQAVPEDFQGHWQDEAARLGARFGAQLGKQQRDEQEEAAASDFQVLISQTSERLSDAILGGRPEDADALVVAVETQGQELLRQGVILPHELEAAKNKVYTARGIATIKREAEQNGWNSFDYTLAEHALKSGTGPLADLFPTRASQIQAFSELGNIRASQSVIEAEAKRQREKAIKSRDLWTGVAEDTEENQELADELIGNPDMDPGWWMTGAAQTTETWNQIARMNVLPKSLIGVMRAASRPGTLSPQEREQVFRMVRVMQNGPTPDGSAFNLADKIPDDLAERFLVLGAFMEFGGRSLEEADLWAQNFQQQGYNADQLVRQMEKSVGLLDWSTEFTPETIHDDISNYVGRRIVDELGGPVLPGDQRMMAAWFTKLIATDEMSPEEAWSVIETQLDARYHETEGMYDPRLGVMERSWAAPERAYRVQTDPQPWLFGPLIRATEGLAENYIYGDERPLREAVVPWFDRWAHEQIVEALPDSEIAVKGDPYLDRGEDYRLEAIGVDRENPTYRVYYRDSFNIWTLVPGLTLDPGRAHAAEVNRLRSRYTDDDAVERRGAEQEAEQAGRDLL